MILFSWFSHDLFKPLCPLLKHNFREPPPSLCIEIRSYDFLAVTMAAACSQIRFLTAFWSWLVVSMEPKHPSPQWKSLGIINLSLDQKDVKLSKLKTTSHFFRQLRNKPSVTQTTTWRQKGHFWSLRAWQKISKPFGLSHSTQCLSKIIYPFKNGH
jgi:hypothetical protein